MAKTIGQRLTARRVALKLSKEELSRQSDVSRQTISNIEADRHSPTLSVVDRLARALGIKTTELIGG